MTKDINITKTTACTACQKKMHHGYKAVAISNKKGKIKAYACSDNCANNIKGEKNGND